MLCIEIESNTLCCVVFGNWQQQLEAKCLNFENMELWLQLLIIFAERVDPKSWIGLLKIPVGILMVIAE